MNQLTFENADNDQPTKTTLTLQVTFTHTPATTEAEGAALVVGALTSYARRQGLDIYIRNETERAIGVDEDLLLVKVQDHLRTQIVQAAMAQKLEDDEAAARAQIAEMLLGNQ